MAIDKKRRSGMAQPAIYKKREANLNNAGRPE